MKIVFLATTVAFISICLTWATLAAPVQWKTGHVNAKNQLFKAIINQVLIQQDSPSTKDKDKEMVASYCKFIIQMLKYFNLSGEESFGEGAEDDFCQDFELPPEPEPEEKGTILANAYQVLFDLLKNSGMKEAITGGFNKLLSILG